MRKTVAPAGKAREDSRTHGPWPEANAAVSAVVGRAGSIQMATHSQARGGSHLRVLPCACNRESPDAAWEDSSPSFSSALD